MKYLITGASSGIGEAIAREAAANEHDVVIVARREDKLQVIKAEIEKYYAVSAEIIVADLTKPNDIKKVTDYINENVVDVLVNNAGFGSSGPFIDLDIDNELNEIELNIKALVQLSHCAAKAMVENKFGTVVNISSIASYQPMVGNATYGATKSFVTSFSHALSEELKNTGVDILLVCPGLTVSEFHERSKWVASPKGDHDYPKFLWKNSDEVAKMLIKSVQNHRAVLIPGVLNKALALISSSLPGSVTKKITAVVAKGRRTR